MRDKKEGDEGATGKGPSKIKKLRESIKGD